MANRKQLAILKQGVAAWNKWREENPDAKINLRGAKLDGMNLSEANFHKADIRGVSFRKAVLTQVNFTKIKTGNSIYGIILQIIFIGALTILSKLLLDTVSIFYSSKEFPFIYAKDYIIILFIIINFFFIKRNKVIIAFVNFVVLHTLLLFSVDYILRGNITFATVLGSVFITSISLINILSIIAMLFIMLNSSFTIIAIALSYILLYIDISIFWIFEIVVIPSIVISLCIAWRIRKENSQVDLLRKIELMVSTLFGTNFRETNLMGAIFDKANLKHARFGKAILKDTSFRDAQGLQFARCNGTILDDRDVRELLVRGNGQGLSLKGKNLQGAHLVNADLRGLDLRETDLMQANLSRADITGAKLYGSARENWIIDGIRCDYVYWDETGEQRTPPDRDFRPGEFEELYKQLPTFEYVFANGFTPLDPLIMDRVVQAVNERHKDLQLTLVNFDKRGQPHATFTVCHLEHVEKAKQQIAAGYERNKIAPDQREQLMAAVLGLIENQNKLIDKIPSSRELTMGDTYQIYGGQIGAIGQSASASGNIFQQITAELSRLHEEMQHSAKTPEQKAAAEDIAKAAQAAQQQNEPAVRQHLKNAGKFALDCAQKIGAEALAEYLKKMTLGL